MPLVDLEISHRKAVLALAPGDTLLNTRLDRLARRESFYAFAIETARVGCGVVDEVKPLQQTAVRVFDIIDKAKELIDALPPWAERKKIEGPKPPPSGGRMDDLIDDDIPF